jgi:hypothetical protein
MSTANTILSGAGAQSWNLALTLDGALTVPVGNTYTDGYRATLVATVGTAAMTADKWQNICIQYLDSNGQAVTGAERDYQGAPFLCAQVHSGAADGDMESGGIALTVFTFVLFTKLKK